MDLKIKKIKFKNIIFHDISFKDLSKFFFVRKNLICLPSGPGLSSIDSDSRYLKSLQHSTFNLFDSGLFCLLLKIKGISVNKFSGYKFISNFFVYLASKKNLKILLVNPSKVEAELNINYLSKKYRSCKFINYIAPIYINNFNDYELLDLIVKNKPDFIIINIGGGVQENIGAFLFKKINFNSSIICSGAALSFFTKSQAPINSLTDKLYMGWFLRCVFKPKIFIPRYIKAFKFIKVFLKNSKSLKIIL